MILGVDCSTQVEVDAKNPHYFYQGKEIDPWKLMHDQNGISMMRLRIWVDPYSPKGEPYGGGTNDYPTFLKLAKRAIQDGYGILLDFHYSDFWCDPGKQTMPKAWVGLNLDQLTQKVYDYTKEILLQTRKDHLPIAAIQIGNEITNGMLWPLGALRFVDKDHVREGYDNLAVLLKAGLKAAREIYPKAKLMIHLERSGDLPLHQEFYGEIAKRGVEYDVIGLSYYPYWHGPFETLFKNVENLKAHFHKPIWIVETGYGFTMEPFILGGGFQDNLISEKFFQDTANVCRPYPLSKEGQNEFVKTLILLAKKHGVEAIYYWEPTWLPLPGIEWASKAGEAYTNELQKPTHNEWANQCLFDYQGQATPAFDSYKI